MESQYIAESIADDVRVDGRSRLTLRDFFCKRGVNSQSRGSAQVWLGETCVVCFVFSDVTDGTMQTADASSSGVDQTDVEASKLGLAVRAKVISTSEDVDQSTLRSVNQDLSSLYRRIGANRLVKEGVTDKLFKSCDGRCGIGVKVTAEITILSGAGGNVLSACAIAVKSALFDSSFPPVHVVAGAPDTSSSSEQQQDEEIILEAASVEVDEQRRESAKSLGMACPLVVKSITTNSGFYCVDPCREEEAAASYEVIVGCNSSNNNSNSISEGKSKIVYSRMQSCNNNNNSNNSNSSKNQKQQHKDLSVNDITTLLSESSSLGERLMEQWTTRLVSS